MNSSLLVGTTTSSLLFQTPSPLHKRQRLDIDQQTAVFGELLSCTSDWWADSSLVVGDANEFGSGGEHHAKEANVSIVEMVKTAAEEKNWFDGQEEKMKHVIFSQARELFHLSKREAETRAALLDKHRKIQEAKELEFKAQRDKLNFRHYAVYLEVAGLNDKLF
jgi:uncharacterized protein YkuJ